MSDLEHAVEHLEAEGNFDGAAAVRQMIRDNERYRRLLEKRGAHREDVSDASPRQGLSQKEDR